MGLRWLALGVRGGGAGSPGGGPEPGWEGEVRALRGLAHGARGGGG
jgi:hypothetical protein